MKKLIVTLAAVAAAGLPVSAAAQGRLSHEQLLERIEQLEAQNAELKELVMENIEKTDEIAQTRPVITGSNGFGLETPDGRFSVNLRGRVQADLGYIDDDDDFFDGQGAEFRRARLGIEGKAGSSNVRYRFETNFGEDGAEIEDAWIQLRGEVIGKDRVTFGQFKTPNSLTEQTSSRFVGFMERPAFTDAFGFDRQIGIGGRTQIGDVRAEAGVFFGGFDLDLDDGAGVSTDPTTLAGRLIYTPRSVFSEGDKLHLGASARARFAGDNDDDSSNDGFEYDADLPIQLGKSDYVQVDDFAERDVFVGGEFAYGFGSAHFGIDGGVLFAEGDSIDGDTPLADGDAFFWGLAGEAGFWLTGEENTVGGGAIGGRPRVKASIFDGGFGAFQIVGRVDYIDLTDEDADPVLAGGEALQLTAGLNWWLTPHVLIQPNFFYATLEDAEGGGDTGEFGADGENDAYGVGVRAQVDW